MFKKVLVCLDGSGYAEEILPYIMEEGKAFGKIVLLNVVMTPVINLPVGVPGESIGPVQTEAMLKRFKEVLEDAPYYLEEKAKALREKGLKVATAIVQGTPSREIINYARENGVTLIAIATHGHSGFREITMGSTAEYVLKNSGLPVLLFTPKKGK